MAVQVKINKTKKKKNLTVKEEHKFLINQISYFFATGKFGYLQFTHNFHQKKITTLKPLWIVLPHIYCLYCVVCKSSKAKIQDSLNPKKNKSSQRGKVPLTIMINKACQNGGISLGASMINGYRRSSFLHHQYTPNK